METIRLGAIERRFAELIWHREPIHSGELVKLCQEELGWKKSTTYTVLKKLCLRGLFQNKSGTVTALISEQDYQALQSQQFLEETFDGSLPAFVAAFSSRNKLSDAEIRQLQQLIEENRK